MKFQIEAFGHLNILASHKTTWQLTKESSLTPKGDCVIGVSSNASTTDIPDWLKVHLHEEGEIFIKLKVQAETFFGTAKGHRNLTFTDNVDMVFRKSDFISPRTLAIQCSFAAIDLPETIISKLKNPNSKLYVEITKNE